MYHFSGMPLKLTIAPSICKPRLTLAIAFADSTDGLTDATSNSGRAAGAWLKTVKQLRAVRRAPRNVCIIHFTIRRLEKIHESLSPKQLQPRSLGGQQTKASHVVTRIGTRCLLLCGAGAFACQPGWVSPGASPKPPQPRHVLYLTIRT